MLSLFCIQVVVCLHLSIKFTKFCLLCFMMGFSSCANHSNTNSCSEHDCSGIFVNYRHQKTCAVI